MFGHRGLLLLVSAGALAIPALRPASQTPTPAKLGGPVLDSTGLTPKGGAERYGPQSREHYLTADQVGYIRPGFKLKVNSIKIGTDRKPVVDVSFTDDLNQPLDRLGQTTPGPLAISFILAWWDGGVRSYTAYTTRVQTSPITGVSAVQAGTDAGGTFKDLETGHATYTFKTALPEGFDGTKTHTLGIYGTRNMAGIQDKNYYANAEYDFRPDGKPVTETWAAMDMEKSCNNCHDPISAHGGARRDVKLCVLCHQKQTIDPDTGNTVDFKVMLHKVHRGKDLPSVKAGTPYQIIGFNQTVADYSTVVYPQDIRNCQSCHEASAPEAAIWYTRPTRAACGSCHDDVNWTSGENHAAGAQADDKACATCHAPQGDREFDASIKGSHVIETKSTQLAGLKADIVSAEQTGPGKNPVVTFKLTNGDGSAVDPKPFGSNLNLLLGGPTTDYAIDPFRENASGATFNGTLATYTFKNAIPKDATGTWALAIEARRTITLNPGTTKQRNVIEGALNRVKYIAVTGGEAKPRREIVTIAKCNVCHDRLALHGGQRFVVEECIICHNPNASDKARRPADKGPVESINFKRLIHRIHTGDNLTQDYTVYGFFTPPNPPNPVNFNEVRFPGDRRDCLTCHVNAASYGLPTGGTLDTVTLRDYFTPQGPGTAACLGCHDLRDNAAHAYINTAPFGEACATCHGNAAEFSVEKVHAR